MQCLFPSLSQKPKTYNTHAHWSPKMKKQRRQALRAAAQPPYPFGMIGQGRVALSPFPLINTRVRRTKRGGAICKRVFERTLKCFFKRTRERENKGERKT